MALFDRLRQRLFPKDTQVALPEEEPVPASDGYAAGAGYRVAELLTPREYELFGLLLQGYTLKECARQLSVKVSTANIQMKAVYRKLGVRSRAELIIRYHSAV